MHSRTPWILMALALALFGYIWMFERPSDGEPATAPRRLFPELDPARVTALSLVVSNTPIRLTRAQGRWQLEDPVYPAQSVLVENWIDSVAQLESRDRLEPELITSQPGGLATLGLDPPRTTVSIEQADRKFQFQIGDPTPLGPTMYLQVLGATAVEITGAEPRERLPSSAVDWRDPQFLHLAGLRFDRIQMRSPGREYEVVRDPSTLRWRLTKPRSARADHGRVEQLVQQLQAAQVQGFLSGVAVADLEPFGLQNPEAVLTLSQGTNLVLNVEFGRAPTDARDLVYARRSNLAGIVLAPRDVLELAAVNYTDLLDYRLIDRPTTNLEMIEIQASESFTLERGTNTAWQVTAPTSIPTDPGLTAALVEHLRDLRVAEVAKEVVTDLDLSTYGLAEPWRQVHLTWSSTGEGAPPTPLRLDFGTNTADRVYVRRSDESPVYAVEAREVAMLPRAAFELRDRRLWDFSTNEVLSFTLTRNGTTQKLLRSPRGQWTVAPGSQGIVNTFALEEAVHRLGSLRARWWVDRGAAILPDYGILPDGHRLVLELSQKGQIHTRTLDFGAASPSGGPFAATELDGEPTVFECPLDVFYPYEEVLRSMSLPR